MRKYRINFGETVRVALENEIKKHEMIELPKGVE
jgi:hypothetical protein